MIIMLAHVTGNAKPDSETPGFDLWDSRSSEEHGADLAQIPASVLVGASGDFQVGAWFDVLQGRQMFGATSQTDRTWTEAIVLSPAGISHPHSVLQVPELVAALQMITAALDLAAVLSSDGKVVWIRVE